MENPSLPPEMRPVSRNAIRISKPLPRKRTCSRVCSRLRVEQINLKIPVAHHPFISITNHRSRPLITGCSFHQLNGQPKKAPSKLLKKRPPSRLLPLHLDNDDRRRNQKPPPIPTVSNFGSECHKLPLWSTLPLAPTSSYGNAYPLLPRLVS